MSGSLLIEAARRGDIKSLQQCLDNGANINYFYDGRTPLIFGVLSDHVDCVRLLVSRKANLELTTPIGHTALTLSAHHHYASVQVLLDAGANIDHVDSRGHTAIMWSISSYTDRLETLRLLLRRGADLNLRNAAEQSVMDIAKSLPLTRHRDLRVKLLESVRDILWSPETHSHFAAPFKSSVLLLLMLHRTSASAAGQLVPCHANAKNRLSRPLLLLILSFAAPPARFVPT